MLLSSRPWDRGEFHAQSKTPPWDRGADGSLCLNKKRIFRTTAPASNGIGEQLAGSSTSR